MVQSGAERQKLWRQRHKGEIKAKAAAQQAEFDDLRARVADLENQLSDCRRVSGMWLTEAQENQRICLTLDSTGTGYWKLNDKTALRFMGYSKSEWIHANDEMLEHFGLTEIVARWRRKHDEELVSATPSSAPRWDRGELYTAWKEEYDRKAKEDLKKRRASRRKVA